MESKLRALQICRLFRLELLAALEECQRIAIIQPESYPHSLYHSFKPSLQGGRLEDLIENMRFVLLPNINMNGHPDWLQLGEHVKEFLVVLDQMDPTPTYGCMKCS